MASLTVVFQGNQAQIKTTPAMAVSQVLEEACKRFKVDESESYILLTEKEKPVDLSLPYRLSGLSSGQKLLLRKNASKGADVNVALQVLDGERFQHTFPSATTLLAVMEGFEAKIGKPLRPSEGSFAIRFLNREIPNTQFESTSLRSLGLSTGSGLLKLIGANVVSPSPTPRNETPNSISSQPSESQPSQSQTSNPEPPQETTETKPMEIDQTPSQSASKQRNFEVLLPPSKVERIDLPDEFYEVTVADLASIRPKDRSEEPLQLRDRTPKKSYDETQLRVRFPDRIEIQVTFGALEKTDDLITFLRSNLRDPALRFYLFISPPVQRLILGKTFKDQGLLPSAVVHFALDQSYDGPILKEEITGMAKEIKLEDPSYFVKEPEIVETKKSEAPPSSSDASSSSQSASQGKSIPKWLKLKK
eukprot:TRINITY_DN2684_c2_g1_i1.p1 TRINITY_DN2684_c2_g1~~TRINITY_DN2684_c2_g1_i1.p1  ORF type:complete len:427 (-),score=120.55 TRINITY_DN2684_c2_g1_i1:71-1327(-)